MQCDHFVSSENLLNQNASVLGLIGMSRICNWFGWSEVPCQNFKTYQTNFTPDENLSKRNNV